MKRKPIHFYCETWMQSFWIMEGWEFKQAQKWMAKVGFDVEHQKFYQGKTLYKLDGTGPIIIWTQPAKVLWRRMSILAHECVHAAHLCLDRAGVRPDFINDEAVAYLVTVLMRKALRKR